MSNRRALLWAALALVPLGVPLGATAQERTVVSNQIAISGRDASLTLEFSDGVSTELSFRDGVVSVNGEALGSYEAGDALASSWRSLLGEILDLSNGPLASALVDWAPPTGLSDELTATGAALDRAIEAEILASVIQADAMEEAASAEASTEAAAEVSVTELQEVAEAAAALAAEAQRAGDRSFSAQVLNLGDLLRSPRLLRVIEAVEDMDIDLEEVRAFAGEDVDVRAGQTVDGVLLVVDGDLDVRGDVEGDVILAGGRLRLHDGGAIHGDVRLIDARLDDRGGDLYGNQERIRLSDSDELDELREDLREEIRRELEQQFEGTFATGRSRSIFSPFRHIWRGVTGIFQNLITFGILAALGALVLYFWPARVEVVATAAKESMPKAAMVGLAGAFLFVPIWLLGIVALAISIVGIPALLAWVPLFPVAGGVAGLFGFLAVSMLVGDWVQEKRIRGFEWADGSSAMMRMAAGIFAVTMVFMAGNVLRMGGPLLGFFHGLLSFVACIGLIAMVSIGFGAVLLTRGGRRQYAEGSAFLDEDWSWRSWRSPGEADAADVVSEADAVVSEADAVVSEADAVVSEADAVVSEADAVVDEVIDAIEDAPKTTSRRRGPMRNAGFLALVALLTFQPATASGQTWRDFTVSRVIAGEAALDVRIEYGAGEFDLVAADEGDLLYRMDLRYDEEHFQPRSEYGNGVLELGVESVRRRINVGRNSKGQMDVELARGVPMSLDVQIGAARADLDLGGLSLTEARISTGASQTLIDVTEANPVRMDRIELTAGAAEFTARRLGNLNAESISVDAGVGEVTLDFSGDWQDDADVEVDMGLGALELRFPKGLGVSLEKDSFLTSLDAQGMVKRGDMYYSVDWDEAETRVRVSVDAAFGSIKVVWVG